MIQRPSQLRVVRLKRDSRVVLGAGIGHAPKPFVHHSEATVCSAARRRIATFVWVEEIRLERVDSIGESLAGDHRCAPDRVVEERAMLELAAQLRSISDSVDAELRMILTPVQRIRLDSLRRPPTFILKRQDNSGARTVDTVYPPAKH